MRRKHHEEHVNHESWAIPYADLMTLLLAFFVVMYAVSVVNEGKYRVMSQSIIEAFNGSSRRLDPVHASAVTPAAPVPAERRDSHAQTSVLPRVALPLPTRNLVPSATPDGATTTKGAVTEHSVATGDATSGTAGKATEQENLEQIRNEVQHALQPLIDKNLVVVRRTPNWLEIEIRTDILFPSGVAQLSAPADDVLRHLAGILAPFPNPLRVEGYTDDVPINTTLYPSNWELSAARAASVARLFAEHGVDPNRLGIIGWGEYRPEADNASADGRNRNRRVLVVVLSDHNTPTRFYSDADRLGRIAENDPGSAPAPTAVPATSAPVVAEAGAGVSAPDAGDRSPPAPPSPPAAIMPVAAPVPATERADGSGSAGGSARAAALMVMPNGRG